MQLFRILVIHTFIVLSKGIYSYFPTIHLSVRTSFLEIILVKGEIA